MFHWFPAEASLLAATVLICFACEITEQSPPSLSIVSSLISPNLPMSSLSSLSAVPCCFRNYLFEVNEELFFASRSFNKVKIFPSE